MTHPTAYQRWELFLTPQNIAAGENIRWLPRAAARDLDLPGYDWWMLDGERLIITTYDDDAEVATRTVIPASALILADDVAVIERPEGDHTQRGDDAAFYHRYADGLAAEAVTGDAARALITAAAAALP